MYFCRYANGDHDARRILIERNQRLVAYVAKKFQNYGKQMEDLISTGNIGLIKAIDTFKRDNGARLASYAAPCIHNEILMALRKAAKEKNEVPFHAPIGQDREGNEITLLDVLINNQDDILDQVDRKQQIARMNCLICKCLCPREQTVINHRYGLSGNKRMSQHDIGAMLGLSRSYISRIETSAVKELRRLMQDCDGE